MQFGYLAATARSEFWSRTDPILLLGSWCRPGLDKIKPVAYEELPCIWETESAVAEAEAYCWNVFRRLTPQLGKSLNRLHGVSRSERYWEVLLSLWFLHFINVLYDRFLVGRLAAEGSPDARTTILPRESFIIPAASFDAVKGYSYDDRQNLQLFSEVFAHLGVKPTGGPTAPVSAEWPEIRTDQRPKLRQYLGSLKDRVMTETFKVSHHLLEMGRGLKDGDRPLLYLRGRFKRSDLLVLSKSSGFTLGFPNSDGKHAERFESSRDARKRLSKDLTKEGSAGDEFEALVLSSAAYFTPTCFVEGYGNLASGSLARFGPRARFLVFDAPAFTVDPIFLEYAARCREAGRILVNIQHGGAYGHTLSSPTERIEVELCDRFISFGWKHDRFPEKSMPLPSPHLSYLRRVPSRDSILYISFFGKAYLHRLVTIPHGSQWDHYLDYCETFLKSLRAERLDKVRFRPFFLYSGYRLPPLMESLMKGGQRESRLASRALSDCRLAVVDHPSTSWLEALASNTPTVLFWNPSHWPFRPSARTHVEELHKAGILFYDPVSAAKQVEQVYDRVDEWWFSEKRQRARAAFCERYARATPDWRNQWVRALRELARQGR